MFNYLFVHVNNRDEFSGGKSDLLWDISVGIRTAMILDGCWCLNIDNYLLVAL
jgi:hypothetical protein